MKENVKQDTSDPDLETEPKKMKVESVDDLPPEVNYINTYLHYIFKKLKNIQCFNVFTFV